MRHAFSRTEAPKRDAAGKPEGGRSESRRLVGRLSRNAGPGKQAKPAKHASPNPGFWRAPVCPCWSGAFSTGKSSITVKSRKAIEAQSLISVPDLIVLNRVVRGGTDQPMQGMRDFGEIQGFSRKTCQGQEKIAGSTGLLMRGRGGVAGVPASRPGPHFKRASAAPDLPVVGSRSDVLAQRDFLAALLETAHKAHAAGESKEQLQARTSIAKFEAWRPLGTFVTMASLMAVAYDEVVDAPRR